MIIGPSMLLIPLLSINILQNSESVRLRPTISVRGTIPEGVTKSECPSNCHCQHENNRVTTDCSENGMDSPPDTVYFRTYHLALDRNNFPILRKSMFLRFGDKEANYSVQKLTMSDSGVHKIEIGAFNGLNLKELDLSKNNLVSLPKRCFAQLSLEILNLRQNKLHTIEDIFDSESIKIINLRKNKIELIRENSKLRLPKLTRLDLRDNQLKTLSPKPFRQIPLKQLILSGNPWQCDCYLRPLKKWLNNRGISTSDIYCGQQGSSTVHKLWDKMESYEFACPPQITHHSPVDTMIRIAEGGARKLVLECETQGNPTPTIIWEIKNKRVTSMKITKGDSHKYKVTETNISDTAIRSMITCFNITKRDEGAYQCTATNINNQHDDTTFTLVVDGARDETIHLMGGPNGKEAEKVTRVQSDWLIAIFIATAATILVLAIVIVIVCMRRRQLRRTDSFYNAKNCSGYEFLGNTIDRNGGVMTYAVGVVNGSMKHTKYLDESCDHGFSPLFDHGQSPSHKVVAIEKQERERMQKLALQQKRIMIEGAGGGGCNSHTPSSTYHEQNPYLGLDQVDGDTLKYENSPYYSIPVTNKNGGGQHQNKLGNVPQDDSGYLEIADGHSQSSSSQNHRGGAGYTCATLPHPLNAGYAKRCSPQVSDRSGSPNSVPSSAGAQECSSSNRRHSLPYASTKAPLAQTDTTDTDHDSLAGAIALRETAL